VALSQGLEAAPHGVMIPLVPQFSESLMKLRGMGNGSQPIGSAEEYRAALTAGHFWCTLLTGAHVSTDVALVDGEARWWRHTTGATGPGGTFDHWLIHAEAMPEIEDWCGAWSRQHLRGYTGMANFETIGGRIIEAHLRFADQWPDLYGAGWVEERLTGFSGIVNFETIGGRIIECHLRMSEQWLDLNGPGWLKAVVRLYAEGVWEFDDSDRRTGYSVVLFGAHGVQWQPPATRVADLLKRPHISSIQITFDDAIAHEAHAMPPGGFRLAIVNCWDLAVGKRVRALLKDQFDAGLEERRPRRAVGARAR